MLKHRHIDRICFAAAAVVLILTLLFSLGVSGGFIAGTTAAGYENKLFDTDKVHTIDIVMDDWDGFLDTAASETYMSCSVVIDGEKYGDVGIRGKGNTSLSSVASYGNDRYSFKIEFDQYTSGKSYYGLDKISLNNLISDNTYMKDYLCYTMMRDMGVAAPLCSFVYITVNGSDWGLYLAVESVEDSFLQRNYGSDNGELYKPDSLSMGGGVGNGRDFSIGGLPGNSEDGENTDKNTVTGGVPDKTTVPGGDKTSGAAGNPENANLPGGAWQAPGGMGGGKGGGIGSSDVKLQYIDDNPDSYSNIFNNAKTDVSEADEARLIASLKTLSEGADADSVVDIETVIMYFAVHNFVRNGDSYTGSMVHNYYLYEEDGVLSMIPWDYNLAFGGFSNMDGNRSTGVSGGATAEVNSPIDSPVSSDELSSRPMIAWIFNSPEYTEQYHTFYAQFLSKYFDSGYFESLLEKTTALISPYVERDPTAFCTYSEFQTGVQALREFCLLRAESVSRQLDGTIPSTQEGQASDSAALVDASGLTLSDMGTFTGGGGGNMGGGMNFGGNKPALDTKTKITPNTSSATGNSYGTAERADPS